MWNPALPPHFHLARRRASPDALSLRRKTIVIASSSSSSDKDPSFPFPPASQRRSLKNLTPSPFSSAPRAVFPTGRKKGGKVWCVRLLLFFSRGIYRALEVCVCVHARSSVLGTGEEGFFSHAARAVIQIRRRRSVKPRIIFKKEFVSNVKSKQYSA